MTKEEKALYSARYFDARDVIIHRVREVFSLPNAVTELIADLEEERRADVWRSVQEECPGITPEEYEAELDAGAGRIKRTFYSEKGYAKPRLVRSDLPVHS